MYFVYSEKTPYLFYIFLLSAVSIFFQLGVDFYFRGDDGVAHGKVSLRGLKKPKKKLAGNKSRFSPLSRLSRNSAASIRTAILIFFFFRFCLFIYTRRIFFSLLLSNLWLFLSTYFSSQLYVNFLPRNFLTYLISYLCNKYLVASVLSLRQDETFLFCVGAIQKIRK